MKRIISSLFFLAIAGMYACNNSSDSAKITDDSSGSDMPAVQNVNGNIPDSSNSSTLDGMRKPVDSTRTKDSVHR